MPSVWLQLAGGALRPAGQDLAVLPSASGQRFYSPVGVTFSISAVWGARTPNSLALGRPDPEDPRYAEKPAKSWPD